MRLCVCKMPRCVCFVEGIIVRPLTVERMSLVHESLHIPKPSDDDRHLPEAELWAAV